MATMNSEVYDALRDAQGVSDEEARKAAEAVAGSENRSAGLDLKIEEIRAAPSWCRGWPGSASP